MTLSTGSHLRQGLKLGLLAAALAASTRAPAAAANYIIATFADDAIANGNCTLREALRASNLDMAVDACPAGNFSDSIILPSGTYGFNGQEELSVPGAVTITSESFNPFDVVIDLQEGHRFLSLSGGGFYQIAGVGIAHGTAGAGSSQGGAIHAVDVSLEMFNFRFVSNSAGGEGGALYYNATGAGAQRTLTMYNGAFLSNAATNATGEPDASGGAADVVVGAGSDANLRDVTFIGNSVADGGSGAWGGALTMFAQGSGSVASCVRCNFESNTVATVIGGAWGGAAAVTGVAGAAINLQDCRFVGNSASASDGEHETAVLFAQATQAAVNLERLFIDFNAGINDSNSRDVVLLVDEAGTLSLVESELTFGAAAGLHVQVTGGTLHMGHLTIADYPSAGAVVRVFPPGQAFLQNSIVAFNGSGPGVPSPPLSNLEVRDGILSQTTNFVGGNPFFLDQTSGNYRLAAASPAIDAGTNSVPTFRSADLDHRSRHAGLRTDIGCFEYDSLFADDFEVGDFGPWSAFSPLVGSP